MSDLLGPTEYNSAHPRQAAVKFHLQPNRLQVSRLALLFFDSFLRLPLSAFMGLSTVNFMRNLQALFKNVAYRPCSPSTVKVSSVRQYVFVSFKPTALTPHPANTGVSEKWCWCGFKRVRPFRICFTLLPSKVWVTSKIAFFNHRHSILNGLRNPDAANILRRKYSKS